MFQRTSVGENEQENPEQIQSGAKESLAAAAIAMHVGPDCYGIVEKVPFRRCIEAHDAFGSSAHFALNRFHGYTSCGAGKRETEWKVLIMDGSSGGFQHAAD